MGLRNRQVKILGEDIRAASGSRNIIEKSLTEKTRTKNRQLEDMFEARVCNFTTVNETNNTREHFNQHLVLSSHLDGLVEKMILDREIDEDNMLKRIGLDGGSGL